ncbi:MAG TPA: type II secretion system protein GspM [Anaeromyxobacteraceae bacterium]|nr:type II secretion system protein GspM [Anaeromyxobacteraceae bacterium]
MSDLWRRLRAAAEAWLSRLSPRERVMVSAAAAAVVLFVLLLVGTGISRSISARESRIEEKTRLLAQIGRLTQGYRQVQAERAALESRLKAPGVPLMSFVAQTGQQLGVEVNDLRPGTPGGSEGISEESVEVSLARIDLPKLARLLEGLERGPGVVKVRRLRVTTRNDDPMLVDVTLLVATYRLKG